jgi:hypothetical protein
MLQDTGEFTAKLALLGASQISELLGDVVGVHLVESAFADELSLMHGP